MSYPKPGSREFNELPIHVQKRIIQDISDRKTFAAQGYLGEKPNSGKTHISASKVSLCTGMVFYA
jgi:hypothetical protein